jgi:hypothetical protein
MTLSGLNIKHLNENNLWFYHTLKSGALVLPIPISLFEHSQHSPAPVSSSLLCFPKSAIDHLSSILNHPSSDPHSPAAIYNTFASCSFIFSSSSFICTTIFWISASYAFDPSVFISRPISCATKPSFLPFDSVLVRVSRK